MSSETSSLSGIRLAAACCCASLVLLAGCRTHAKQLKSLRTAYYSNKLDDAATLADQEIKRRAADADVLKLERAMIDLSAGRAKQAENALREVRDHFDAYEPQDLGESALSYLADDNKRAYPGEDYERVLIRCFLALSNLMHDGTDATAYALQVGQKQEQIMLAAGQDATKNPKLRYKRVALGAYLHGALQEATHRNYDDVARSIQLVVNWEPQFKFGQQDLERATHGRHSAPGHGVLYVVTLVGRGPFKEERAERATSDALLIADRIFSAVGKHSLPPTLAPIKMPVVCRSPSRIGTVKVAIDGQAVGQTETITDVGQMAVDQFEAIKSEIMARAIVRRVVKKGAIYAAKEAAKVEHPLAELALDGVGVAWEATESADTRCWGLLPDKIQVLRVELPAGPHQLSLRAGTTSAAIGPEATERVQITDGRNSYVLATFPDERLIGSVVTNRHDE